MGVGAELERMVVRIVGDTKQYEDSLDKAGKDAERWASRTKKAIKAVTVALAGAATLAAATIGAFYVQAIKEASDAQEIYSKFETVFGQQSDAVKKFADDLAKSTNRSKVELAEYLASFQDLFVPLGFAADQAEAMSKRLTKLTIDLASFNNKAQADVLIDLQAAMTGSGEVMKKYGVIVSEATIKQELLNMGLDPKKPTEVEKAMARLNIILDGTTAAQGDAIRTSDSFANQLKGLQASFKDLLVTAGEELLPVMTEVVKELNEWVKATEAGASGGTGMADNVWELVNAFKSLRNIFLELQLSLTKVFAYVVTNLTKMLDYVQSFINMIPGAKQENTGQGQAYEEMFAATIAELEKRMNPVAKQQEKADTEAEQRAQQARARARAEQKRMAEEKRRAQKEAEEQEKKLTEEKKKQEKAQKDLEKRREQAFNDDLRKFQQLEQRAAALMQNTLSPVEILKQDLQEVAELFANGFLDQEQYNRIQQGIKKDFAESQLDTSSTRSPFKITRAGSRESYEVKARMAQEKRAQEQREKQLEHLGNIATNTEKAAEAAAGLEPANLN